MNLTLDDKECLWCVVNKKGEMLTPLTPEDEYRKVYKTWKENETDSKIFMLKPVGWPPLSQ